MYNYQEISKIVHFVLLQFLWELLVKNLTLKQKDVFGDRVSFEDCTFQVFGKVGRSREHFRYFGK